MVQRITLAAAQCASISIGTPLTLEVEQTHYLARVLRLQAGDRFIVQDGQGQQWLAALHEGGQQAQVIEAIALSQPAALAAPIRLIAALPKGSGFDQVVRQTTELGVTHIYPVISDRTLLKPSSKKRDRWQRIAQEASEQSERGTVPTIFEPTHFKQCLEQIKTEPLQYLCAAREIDLENKTTEIDNATYNRKQQKQLRPHLLSHVLKNSLEREVGDSQKEQTETAAKNASEKLLGVTLAIGPEGGWTPEEITVARLRGYEVVSLGSVILRAVTAPITALSLVTAARELLI